MPANKRAPSIFDDFTPAKPELKNIFARVPRQLRDQIDIITDAEEKSIYETVEVALRMFVKAYYDRKGKPCPDLGPTGNHF